jgi:hypothetical protein
MSDMKSCKFVRTDLTLLRKPSAVFRQTSRHQVSLSNGQWCGGRSFLWHIDTNSDSTCHCAVASGTAMDQKVIYLFADAK